jgi:hypothetical protein
MTREIVRKTCPCCGHRSITGTFDICSICYWEHEPVQEADPEDDGGPNRVGLRQAQRNYAALRVSDPRHAKSVRPPLDHEILDPDWKPLDPLPDES